jgi:hypothetical protein
MGAAIMVATIATDEVGETTPPDRKRDGVASPGWDAARGAARHLRVIWVNLG